MNLCKFDHNNYLCTYELKILLVYVIFKDFVTFNNCYDYMTYSGRVPRIAIKQLHISMSCLHNSFSTYIFKLVFVELAGIESRLL